MSHAHDQHESAPYGVMAEFGSADDLIAATRKAAEAGYTRMDGFSPYPIGEVADALNFPRSEIGTIMFLGGLCGATLGFFMQYWTNAIDYPLNIGGKPLFSWPMFIPITFECTILAAAFGSVLGLLAFIGLPRPHHPIFNTANFDRATVDRFFLCIEAEDPKFDRAATRSFLEGLGPDAVTEVKN